MLRTLARTQCPASRSGWSLGSRRAHTPAGWIPNTSTGCRPWRICAVGSTSPGMPVRCWCWAIGRNTRCFRTLRPCRRRRHPPARCGTWFTPGLARTPRKSCLPKARRWRQRRRGADRPRTPQEATHEPRTAAESAHGGLPRAARAERPHPLDAELPRRGDESQQSAPVGGDPRIPGLHRRALPYPERNAPPGLQAIRSGGLV